MAVELSLMWSMRLIPAVNHALSVSECLHMYTVQLLEFHITSIRLRRMISATSNQRPSSCTDGHTGPTRAPDGRGVAGARPND
jgi:hypothetical protein